MIDSHCHLTYDGLYERVGEVIAEANAAGVDRMVSVGTTPDDARKAIALAQRFEGVFATAGLHPHYASLGRHFDGEWSVWLSWLADRLRELIVLPEVVAIGEMGLDYHYKEPDPSDQRAAFATQLAVMREMPEINGIIHNREATDDTLAVLADEGVDASRFVFHCFTGSPAEVEKILEAGAYVGFTGIVTFGSAKDVAEASDRVPLDRLLIETDSPYLTPAPFRKVRPNEPKYVARVAEFLAERRGVSTAELTAATDANAERLYGLPGR
ncbi:MAG: TatD family hydrolase [Planctomycetota bacterium]